MNKQSLPQKDIDWLRDKLGDALLNEKLGILVKYSEVWRLTEIELQTELSHNNLVFFAVSEEHGKVLFKILLNNGCFDPEIAALRAFQGKSFCPLYAFDLNDKVYIIKKLEPGTTLFEGTSREERIEIFAEIYRNMHPTMPNESAFPSYVDWVQAGLDGIKDRADCAQLLHHAERAMEAVRNLCTQYTEKRLLHGDLHHENILKNEIGEYTVIDPKGVVGDPVFDCSRFILDEFGDDLTSAPQGEILAFIEALSGRIGVPWAVLLQCLYAETAVWLFREELANGETLEECAGLIANMEAAYDLLLVKGVDI